MGLQAHSRCVAAGGRQARGWLVLVLASLDVCQIRACISLAMLFNLILYGRPCNQLQTGRLHHMCCVFLLGHSQKQLCLQAGGSAARSDSSQGGQCLTTPLQPLSWLSVVLL